MDADEDDGVVAEEELVVALRTEEREAVDNVRLHVPRRQCCHRRCSPALPQLCALLGADRQRVLEAYLVCNKDAERAAAMLLDAP